MSADMPYADGVISIATVPGPPLLLPGATGGRVAEVEQLRAACLAAIRVVTSSNPDRILLVGGLRAVDSTPPLSEQVGRSLLEQAGNDRVVESHLIDEDAPVADCLAAGRKLAESGGRVGLLVVADGSARRTLKAPGYLDNRAAPFDDRVVAALRSADAAALAELDPPLAAELLVAGRAAWQVLSGVLAATDVRFTAAEHYIGDPFGVLYPVVSFAAN